MRIGLLTAALAGAALSLAAAGCGGGGPPASTCGIQPCGGDVVGDWTASSACLDHATFVMDLRAFIGSNCPTLSFGDVSMTPRGTLTLGADMTFTGALDVDATYETIYPAACIPDSTCETVEQALQTSVGTNGITSATCTGNVATDGSCTCTTVLTIDIINGTGTYVQSGTMLTFPKAPGGDGPYCVQGSSLHLVDYDRATRTKIVSDLVMTRQ